MQEKSRPCPACHGAGQTSFFKGESRFLLSNEECPECCGLGVVFDGEKDGGDGTGGEEERKEPPSIP